VSIFRRNFEKKTEEITAVKINYVVDKASGILLRAANLTGRGTVRFSRGWMG
jgi:hypothetical protein